MLNTTMCISNLPGPTEEVSFHGHPIAYFAPSIYGLPQVYLFCCWLQLANNKLLDFVSAFHSNINFFLDLVGIDNTLSELCKQDDNFRRCWSNDYWRSQAMWWTRGISQEYETCYLRERITKSCQLSSKT